jgi:nucleoside-diphosphate-sugar epimerase
MSYLNDALKNKKVLVTGATGFIGGRLAQRLATEEGALVTGTGRDFSKVPFLQEANVHLVAANLLDAAEMHSVMAGQEIVFHVAGWRGKGQFEDAYRVNVTATENVIRQAAAAGVQRIVHVSTVGVYGPPQSDCMDEAQPLDTEQVDIYGRSKAIGEIAAKKLADALGIAFTAVRPAMVYGPRAKTWTLGLFQMVKKGVPVLFGDGSGHAHPIFIDNLIDEILLMAVRPQAVGESFNASDPPVNWHTFWSYYGRMAGRKPRHIPMPIAKLFAIISDALKLDLALSRVRLKIYVREMIYPMDKAQKLLGYQARVSLDEGMKQSEAWLRQEGYL